jgi:SulP family sulfate permease
MIRAQRFLPFLRWFPLKREWLKADAIAGVTVALVLIPQSMAYAQLAGLPAYYGLYAAFLPGAMAALFGSSKQLATGPVAVVSLLTASSLIPLAAPGSERFITLAILLTVMVGTIQLALGAFRLGAVVNFLSHPVVLGFTNAAAIIIGLSQLSKIFGVTMGRSESFANDTWEVFLQLPQAHGPTLILGATAFALMWGLKRFVPQVPNVLVAVALTTVASWVVGFEHLGGKVVGTVPEGLPAFALPLVDIDSMRLLLPSAVVISLVGFTEAISIAKAMAVKTRDRLDPNQELIGQGIANMVGSLAQSYPVSGSFSRSAVNLGAGAKTGLSSLFTAAVVLVTLLFLTPALYHLPQAVLAAVIMMAVIGLVNLKAIVPIWHANRHDSLAALATFVSTLAFAPDLDKGIIVGAGMSIFLFLFRAMRPRVAILGRFKDGTLRDIRVHPKLPTDESIILIRFDGQLFFANVAYFEDMILEAVAAKSGARYILVVGNGINQVDASGVEVIQHMVERLRESGVTMVFSGLKRQVLEVLHRTGLFMKIGGDANIFPTADMALISIYKRLGDKQHRPLMPEPPLPPATPPQTLPTAEDRAAG